MRCALITDRIAHLLRCKGNLVRQFSANLSGTLAKTSQHSSQVAAEGANDHPHRDIGGKLLITTPTPTTRQQPWAQAANPVPNDQLITYRRSNRPSMVFEPISSCSWAAAACVTTQTTKLGAITRLASPQQRRCGKTTYTKSKSRQIGTGVFGNGLEAVHAGRGSQKSWIRVQDRKLTVFGATDCATTGDANTITWTPCSSGVQGPKT